MQTPETVQIKLAGHEIRLTAEPGEKEHIEAAAQKVNETFDRIQASSGGAASPVKLALMAAFQFAFDLSMADETLKDASRLHGELQKEKDAVQRLEKLLARMDDAIAS